MIKHYKYGGSTAARSLNCTAWQSLSATLPKPPASHVAELGTALHEVVEGCMRDIDLDPYSFSGQKINAIEITDELIADKIYPALDDLEILMDEYDVAQYWCELSSELSPLIGGTADFVGLSEDGKTLVVADYKSGDGIMVFADENAQGLFYAMCLIYSKALGALLDQVEHIVIAVAQPSERRAESLDIWETDLDRLHAFKLEHDKAVKVGESAAGVAVMGDHCKFCPAEGVNCPAKAKAVEAASGLPINSLDHKRLEKAMLLVDDIENWVKAVRKAAHENLERGTPIKGFKLVDKRAIRCWNNAEKVEQKVKNLKRIKKADAYTEKLCSPAQLEKICAARGVDFQKEFGDYVSAVSSGTTLALASDKREAVVVTKARQLINARFA